jgi:integrase
LVKAEIQWGLHAHAQIRDRTNWDHSSLQRLANYCRSRQLASLFDADSHGYDGLKLGPKVNSVVRMISREIISGLRCAYYGPSDTKDAGFIETDHFGRRFPAAQSHYDLATVEQRWLRDLLWDHLADMLRSPKCPRSRSPFDAARRAAIELGAFLAVQAPRGGHDPALLGGEHAQQFVADLRHRARHGLQSLGLSRADGKPSTVTDVTCRLVFTYAHKLFYNALESGVAAQVGLNNAFITALPFGGPIVARSRNPFTDNVARALADETNLRQFATTYDPHDRGLRDIWETIVLTGRRCNEVVQLRLDCIGCYQGLPMLWHDQTKVGNYNEGIRIPETLYQRLDNRRRKTLTRFEHRHGRLPTNSEREAAALFPTDIRNRNENRSVSYRYFAANFRLWVDALDLGSAVAHQARHTLATNLLRAGATLAHIRRYLGHVSDRMAEHYTSIAHSDLEDVLHAVWVAGPGAANPGELLATTTAPLTRDEALALAVDLSRRSTPADGGFCTFQPVVNGGACPWKLDCENCDKFVLSGADLLYWRRKQEQWRSIAERAPDDATADYLHQVFEPTARAIEGLEKALAGLGLLDQALALDLRRPQDYFHRVWSTNFHVTDLAALTDGNTRPAPSTEETG